MGNANTKQKTAPAAGAEIDYAAEIAELKSEVERLEKENSEQAEQIVSFEEENRELAEKITSLEKDNSEQTGKIAVLEERLKKADTTKDEKEELYELVALTGEGVNVPQLIYRGAKVKREKDADGFYHFYVTREHAESLLTSTAGLKFVLVGPDKSMTLKVRRGVNGCEKVTVYRHTKIKTTKGTVNWSPVIEEESK